MNVCLHVVWRWGVFGRGVGVCVCVCVRARAWCMYVVVLEGGEWKL